MIAIAVFGTSLIITPLAIKLHIIDTPNERKIHDKPVAKAGGLGIFIPFLIGMACLILFHKVVNRTDNLVFSIVTALFVIVGVIDDRVELKARYKLILQVSFSCISIAFGIIFKNLGRFNIPVTFLWYIGMINGINLIDGLDGLSGGIGFICALTFGIIGLLLNHSEIFMVSLFLAAGCLGFLVYNFYPAKIFMGDTGSLPLGYALASIGIIVSNASGFAVDFLLPGIVLCIPIYDTMLAMIRRKLNHKPLFEPDRNHFYNLLMDIHGISHRNTVVLIYAVNVVVSAVVLIFLRLGMIFKLLLVLLLITVAAVLTILLRFITVDKKCSDMQVSKQL